MHAYMHTHRARTVLMERKVGLEHLESQEVLDSLDLREERDLMERV